MIDFNHTGKDFTWANSCDLCYISGTKATKLYPTAPWEKNDLEERLEKKLNDVDSFINNSMKNIKEMITYFKDKNHKSKKNYKKYKMLTTKIKSFDTIVFIATTCSSITLSYTWIGLRVIPISTGKAFGLTISN